ncbi:uncharacterized protein KABA2_06S03344 [Maudiozyma barnettii]|mgnify:FL=1|uniref:Uncharacterized protein n=1 Tax=Maudiozyma barnettii TaxID=61262 RepID=A0A8H2VH31_9SACH|nr:hypothetical protein, no similarity [Kazachstania barnettii]CAB4255346.1 hypothetical protein, no similarity [Kazachstania barnettii]
MGIPLDLYTNEHCTVLEAKKYSKLEPIDDYSKQRLYDWLLLASANSNRIVTSNDYISNHDLLNDPTNDFHHGNSKIDPRESLVIQHLNYRTSRFKQCNNLTTLVYDTEWLQPVHIITNDNSNNNNNIIIRSIDLIGDIKQLYKLVSPIIDIYGWVQKCNSQLFITLILQNNTLIIMSYDLLNFQLLQDNCSYFNITSNIGNQITKVFIEFLPNYLPIVTDNKFVIYNFNQDYFHLLEIPHELINSKYDYFINFPQLLISNDNNCIWQISNILETNHCDIKKFDLAPILRDGETLDKMLITDLHRFTTETNQRIITINTIISEYIDFKVILTKNSKSTMTLHSNDLKKMILIEKNLYSLSLSILNWFQHTEQYVLDSYNDLQSNLLSSAEQLPISNNTNNTNNARDIHYAHYNDEYNTITLYHSNPMIIDTFVIMP